MVAPVLEMRGITKRFPGIVANDSVDLMLYPGEIHALLGENGAGKSTLMNVLTGIYAPNEGSILYKGKCVELRNPKNAVELGIGMVHQHFKLIQPLSVAENIFLSAGKCRFLLNEANMEERIRRCSEECGLMVDPAAKVWQLSVGEQQRVEIVKLLFSGAEILILDEPTSVLTPQEATELFSSLRKMADSGKSVLFITHKLFEVMAFSDRITVLRDGKVMATTLTPETTQQNMIQMMVGRDVKEMSKDRLINEQPRTVLKLENVTARNDKGTVALNGLNLEVRSGEILGIAGVAGNGQREMAEVIAGLRKAEGGGVFLDAEEITNKSPKEIIRRKVAYIPEDRMGIGLVGTLNMYENAILRDYDSPECSHRGLLRKKSSEERTKRFVAKNDIKNAGLYRPVSLMSGGNLQKLLIAREINGNPTVIVAAYPVHGVDIGATESIHETLLEQRARGAAILLISEDLEELYEMSDRVAALYEGQIVDTIDIKDFTYEGIGRLMVGLTDDAKPKDADVEVAQ